MKPRNSINKISFLILLLLLMGSVSAQDLKGTFEGKMEIGMGDSYYRLDKWLTNGGTTFSRMEADASADSRAMASNFMANYDNTQFALHFSAETAGDPMLIQCLVDGQVIEPGPVIFNAGSTAETRSFIFAGTVDRGLHTVHMEWRTITPGHVSKIQNASMVLRKDDEYNPGRMKTATATNGVSNNAAGWQDIPDMIRSIEVEDDEILNATISMVSKAQENRSAHVRAVVVGQGPMSPSNVLFTHGKDVNSRSATFGIEGLPKGQYRVKFQWQVQNTKVNAYKRTMVLSSTPTSTDECDMRSRFLSAGGGENLTTSSNNYNTIPGMNTNIMVPANGEIMVIFSAETAVSGVADMEIRLRVGNQTIKGSAVRLAQGANSIGTQSYMFIGKNINFPGTAETENVRMEWRSSFPGKTVEMGDRSMMIMTESGPTPDLWFQPALGLSDYGMPPAIGEVPVLVIQIDPGRLDHPDMLPNQQLEDQLFTGTESAKGWFEACSNGKFTISNAGIYSFEGPYHDTEPNHYWNPHCCEIGDEVCIKHGDSEGTFRGGHIEKALHAVQFADAAGFDFAAYDANKDGILNTKELAILIVTPQNTEGGDRRGFLPWCDLTKNVEIDGVILPVVTQWYTNALGVDYSTAIHELSHTIFGFGDYYIKGNHATESGQYSMMAENGGATPYFDAHTRMVLGWATPRWVGVSGNYGIPDVRNDDRVLILPRTKSTDGKEYFMLEGRNIDDGQNSPYDEGMDAKGIALWHIVETPGDAYFEAKNATCQGNWPDLLNHKINHVGIRLIRPTVTDVGENYALWRNGGLQQTWSTSYAIDDNSWKDCDQNGVGKTQIRWADNTPSGYAISGWPSSQAVMNINITIPPKKQSSPVDCPEDTPSLDVFAGPNQSSYPDVEESNCKTLTATATGCEGPYTYTWSNGMTGRTINVCPRTTTTYTVTVSNARGTCTATDQVTVDVLDITCHKNGKMVNVCKNGKTLCVNKSAVPGQLQSGAVLGSCDGPSRKVPETAELIEAKAAPNPFSETTNIVFSLPYADHVSIEVFDLNGKRTAMIFCDQVDAGTSYSAEWNSQDFGAGIYFYRLTTGKGDIVNGKIMKVE